MQQKLKEFYKVLEEDYIELYEVEFAEIIWLATQISNHPSKEKTFIEMLSKRLNSLLEGVNFNFFNQDSSKELESNETKDKEHLTEKLKIKGRRTKKRSASAPLIASSKNSQNTLPFRTPVNNYIYNSHKWLRALRHFKQKQTVFDNTLFDEEKTADYIASNNLFIAQYKANYEKRFEVVFIVDVSDSMSIWEALIDEFSKSIKSFGIFKKVTVYYMESHQGFKLYKTKEKRRVLNDRWYRSLENETVCFVLSDMLSNGWQNAKWLDTFDKWQKFFPLSIVQMLPYHLWKGTILNRATLTRFSGTKIYGKNKSLKSRVRFKSPNENTLKVPILNLEANSFDSYGKLFLGQGSQSIDGAVFELNKTYELVKTEKRFKTSEERVSHFYKIASEEAKRLAEYFSVIPLTFPVMKIVQQVLLKESSQIHLSEIFMSGIIDKENKQGEIYSFYSSEDSKESVREILLNLLGTSKAVETIVKISNFVSTGKGRFDFLAFLQDPDYLQKSDVSSEFDREFARISATLLEKMGGEYAQKANDLIEFIEYEEDVDVDEITLITPTSKRFIMGSDENDDEKPIHEVIINYDFEIAQTPVTVGEFKVFVEETDYITEAEKGDGAHVYDGEDWKNKKDASWKNPYFEQTDKHPVVCVSWNDAQAYIKWLNEKTGETYRLPTEEEWEFSCRADSVTKWYFGNNEKILEDYAWYGKKGANGTKPVGLKKANQWGLYDMYGNVWEWCFNYSGIIETEEDKEYKALRGGSWNISADSLCSSCQIKNFKDRRASVIGFRILKILS